MLGAMRSHLPISLNRGELTGYALTKPCFKTRYDVDPFVSWRVGEPNEWAKRLPIFDSEEKAQPSKEGVYLVSQLHASSIAAVEAKKEAVACLRGV